jgi:RES domain-containing protein
MWSFTPLSGEGARKSGGRFNRKGETTLYLSLDIITAVNECTQGLGRRLQPLTMCEYDIDCEPIADLRTDTMRAALGVSFDDLNCPWLSQMLASKDVPSWRVAEAMINKGFGGMLVPSFAPGAGSSNHNLVLWRWGPDLPMRVSVYDPAGRLPKDQTSWRT